MILENKKYYNGKDISYILVAKVEHTIRVLSARNDHDFESVYEKFVKSKTHKALQNPDTLLWTESSEFIADEYDRETTLFAR
jgi:hypothetical protein